MDTSKLMNTELISGNTMNTECPKQPNTNQEDQYTEMLATVSERKT